MGCDGEGVEFRGVHGKGVLIIRSSDSVERNIEVLLRDRRCRIVRTRGNIIKLGLLSRAVSLIVLSVVVPGLGNLGIYRRVHGASGIPMLFLATGSRRSSGLLKLVIKKSSCLTGPFSCTRLLKEIGTLLEHCRICRKGDAGRGRTRGVVRVNSVGLGATFGRVITSKGGIRISSLRCGVLHLVVRRPNGVFSARGVCRDI